MTSTFYPPFHLGGDAVHVKVLAEELVKRGHEVQIMHSLDAYHLKRRQGSTPMKQGKVLVHSLKSPYGKSTPFKVFTFGYSNLIMKEYEKLVHECKPDVVHHHNISLLGHKLFMKIGPYKQLYTAHDYWLICPRNDLMRKKSICTEKRCISCLIMSGRPPQLWRSNLRTASLDCVICPSMYMKNKLEGVINHSAVLHNTVPKPPSDIQNSEHGEFYLYIGVLEKHKGVLKLLEAFEMNDEKLVFIGEGKLKMELSRRINKNSNNSRIQCLGWVENKWPFIKDAKAVIIPSLWPENCPMVALEAMSVGTPVICSDIGGTKEIVNKLSDQYVIPIDRLTKTLTNITALPTISKNMVKETFAENFSIDRYMDRYLRIIKEGCPST